MSRRKKALLVLLREPQYAARRKRRAYARHVRDAESFMDAHDPTWRLRRDREKLVATILENVRNGLSSFVGRGVDTKAVFDAVMKTLTVSVQYMERGLGFANQIVINVDNAQKKQLERAS